MTHGNVSNLFRGLLLAVLLVTAGIAGAETAATNLARGKKCSVFSTLQTNSFTVSGLTDGQRSGTGWSSRSFAEHADHALYPEYVVVDLGRNCKLDRIELYPDFSEGAAGIGFPEDFTIQICREGEVWKIVADQKGCQLPVAGGPQIFQLTGLAGRYIKVEATRLRKGKDGKHRFQLAEVEVYGLPKKEEPLEGVAADIPVETGVYDLRSEHRTDPLGVGTGQPRLEWKLRSSGRGTRQTAFRILVAGSKDILSSGRGDLWDTGRIEGDRTIAVRYEGKVLKSGQRCFWKVMSWYVQDKDGGAPDERATAWSDPAVFVTGKLRNEDWKGLWIGADIERRPKSLLNEKDKSKAGSGVEGHPALYFRKEIDVEKTVTRATAYFCGLGFSELSIDGTKIGDGLMTPGFTTYDKRVQYLVHDVTSHFAKSGRKTLGVILVDGWYGLTKDPWHTRFHMRPYIDQPKMRLDLELEFSDGSRTTVAADSSWKWSTGEITRSFICEEDIDLRKRQQGWGQNGFSDTSWKGAVVLKGPDGAMVCQMERPTRVIEVIKPQNLSATANGKSWVYDFGREFTGSLRFRASAPAGTEIRMTIILPVGAERRVSRFIPAGTGVEEYFSRFCYTAITRVQIDGLTSPPSLDDLSGVMISGVDEVSGGFRCSNDLLNWLDGSARRTQRNYTTFLPNDPTREYKAWMQDPQNMFRAAVHMYDSRVMYERWQYDIRDCQRDDGNVANVAPGPYWSGCNSPWWGGCVVWLPWHWYLEYGDPGLLFESYEVMKRYVDYLEKVGKYHIQDWGLHDWISIEYTPMSIVNTPAYYLYAQVVSRTAGMLGRTEESIRYAKLAEEIRGSYNGKFLDPVTGIYGVSGSTAKMERWWDKSRPEDVHETWWTGKRPCTQAGQVLPLALGLVPEEVRSKAESALVREIAAHSNRVSTGFVATPYLLELLADLAPGAGYDMTSTMDYPSWYSMTAGASGVSRQASDHDLMQEGWSGRPVMMPSLGGNIAGWHMYSLGGIRSDPSAPGYKKIIIKPNMVGDLHWVESRYDSVRGRIISNWRKRGAQCVMDITIPANTTATVYVPGSDPEKIMESGKKAELAECVNFLRMDKGCAVYEVGAGRYIFSSTY